MKEILSALALVFIIEGIIPFLYPDAMKKMYAIFLEQDSKNLRFCGLLSMVVGVILLLIFR